MAEDRSASAAHDRARSTGSIPSDGTRISFRPTVLPTSRMTSMHSEHTAREMKMAALVYRDCDDPARVLQEVVSALRQRGVALAGAIERGESSCGMTLELLPSGTQVPISQNLGPNSVGCRLDTVALADAAGMVRQALDASPALAVFSKFGKQEAEGHGLHDEMVTAAISGIPVLTAVKDRLLDRWSDFTGGQFVPLSCSVAAALSWWDGMETDGPRLAT